MKTFNLVRKATYSMMISIILLIIHLQLVLVFCDLYDITYFKYILGLFVLSCVPSYFFWAFYKLVKKELEDNL